LNTLYLPGVRGQHESVVMPIRSMKIRRDAVCEGALMKKVIVVAGAAVIVSFVSDVVAQSPARREFEVVSVKPSADATGPLGASTLPTIIPPVGGRFTALNVTLRFLVGVAYGLHDSQIDGGPDWQMSRRFDIQARAKDPSVGMDAMLPMIKTLLADRFQLKVHTETRESSIYVLVATRDDRQLGAKITRSTAECSNAQVEAQALAEAVAKQGPAALAGRQAGQGLPCMIMPVPGGVAGAMTMRGNGQSMAALAQFLTSATGQIVHDRTGMSGLYDWQMTFDRSVMRRSAQQIGNIQPLPAALQPSDSPSLMIALQEQLGLKLESARGPVDVLVIDSVALPEPN
jgi:uncharacterized protein (TIGR03435 family)